MNRLKGEKVLLQPTFCSSILRLASTERRLYAAIVTTGMPAFSYCHVLQFILKTFQAFCSDTICRQTLGQNVQHQH